MYKRQVQGTYETFAELARQHFDGSFKGRWILTAGLGGMGGAQPLAATMNGASMIAVECSMQSIESRLRTRYLDAWADNLEDALKLVEDAHDNGRAISVGLLGNAADVFPDIAARSRQDPRYLPDVVTDQTSAHDPQTGYLPQGWSVDEWVERRRTDPASVTAAAKASMAVQVRAMLDFWERGVPVVDYGNNIRQMAQELSLIHI